MKVFAIIGIVLSGLGVIFGSLNIVFNASMEDFAIGLIIGIVTLVLSAIPALFKKSVLGYLGMALSLISIFIGLYYGTHMFS